ncbi:MAG: hypothetical protein GC185_13865 [Alphaproteobacteria bacterium]|nr:hypothetical protein [Alphaproteobacteria bacterium]
MAKSDKDSENPIVQLMVETKGKMSSEAFLKASKGIMPSDQYLGMCWRKAQKIIKKQTAAQKSAPRKSTPK